jgi:hypothetical protein
MTSGPDYDRRAMDDPESPPAPASKPPQPSPLPQMRASDAERERAVEILSDAAAAGRLDVDELDERLQSAWSARTRSELDLLVADVDVETVAGRAPAASHRVSADSGSDGSRWIVSIMGGNERRGRWRIAQRCTVINIMGGSDLDLCDAELSDQVTQLNFFSLMGGGEIRVPDGVRVDVSKFAFMGGHEVRLGDDEQPADSPLIRIRLVSIMGGVEVRRGPRRSRREKKLRESERRGELGP